MQNFGIEYEKRMWFKPWIHGKVFFQEPEYKGFQYMLKYALKDDGYGTRKAMMSKGIYRNGEIIEGPLGHDYFQTMAKDMVKKGLPIQNFTYQFAGVRKLNGQLRTFAMMGATKRNFANTHAEHWSHKYGEKALTRAMQWWADRTHKKYETNERQWPHLGEVWNVTKHNKDIVVCPFIAKKDNTDVANGPWMIHYTQEEERNFVRDKYKGRKLIADTPVINLAGKNEQIVIKCWGQKWDLIIADDPMVKVGGTWQAASVEEIRYLLDNGQIVNRIHLKQEEKQHA